MNMKAGMNLNMKNAFNSFRRDHVLLTFMDRMHDIAKLAFVAYSKLSSDFASGQSMTSSSGVQQGDRSGSLHFALAVDQYASREQSELNDRYLVDATICGSPDAGIGDVNRCISGWASLPETSLESSTDSKFCSQNSR